MIHKHHVQHKAVVKRCGENSESGWGLSKDQLDCLPSPNQNTLEIEKEQSQKKGTFLELKNSAAKINNSVE